MQNYVQRGSTLTLPAPAGGIRPGAGLLVGSIFGVAAFNATEGADVECLVEGVFDLPKAAAQAWTIGQKVYWDATAKLCTSTATGNPLIGVATATAANPSATGRVRLNEAFGI